MNEIIKENYDQETLIFDIIEKLPNYIILNKELIDLLRRTKEQYMNEKIFTINSLVPTFEYFEALCWKDMQKNIQIDYQEEVPEKAKQYIISSNKVLFLYVNIAKTPEIKNYIQKICKSIEITYNEFEKMDLKSLIQYHQLYL